MSRRDEIRGRAENATPGEWRAGVDHVEADDAYPFSVAEGVDNGSDVEFIAHCRVDVPYLLDRLQAVLDLHQPESDHDDPDIQWCAHCGDIDLGGDSWELIKYPCPTRRLIEGTD